MTKKWAARYHLLALGGILLVILWVSLPLVRTQPIGYDGAYNAQVAKHYAETGIYATTYPEELRFYKAITTGHTMLLPVAFLYRLFGLGYGATAAVPLVCSCVYAIAAYALFCTLTKGSRWTPLLVLLFALLPTYWVNAIIPVGENMAIAMLLFALLCMVCARREGAKRPRLLWALAGGLMALAFLTKTIAMLYIGIFGVLLFLECLLFRTTTWKSLLSLHAGFAAFFLVFDLFRLSQFGWSIVEWIKSWLAVFANTLRLGGHEGGIFQGITFAALGEKLRALAGMSLTPYPLLFLCQLLLPIGLYFARFCTVLRKKPEKLRRIDQIIEPAMLFSGIAGEAFLVYVLLFGSMELVIIRRLFIHLAMLHVFTGYAWFRAASLTWAALRQKASGPRIAQGAALAACGLVLIVTSVGGLIGVLRESAREASAVSPIRALNEEMMEAVRELPEDAAIYTLGWWQAPEISLFTGRTFRPWEPGLTADDHTYFLMGDEIAAPEDWTGDPEDLLGWLGSIADYQTLVHLANEAAPAPYTYSIYKVNAFLQ